MYILGVFVIICSGTEFAVANDISTPIVTLPNGQIRGHTLTTQKNNTYFAFQEIPYASPPIGSLRFKEPVPPKNWEGILNTIENTKICIQFLLTPKNLDQIKKKETETEDCLYLNVYIPTQSVASLPSNLPVVFYIHGGGYVDGDGTFESWGPEFFIDQNVIMVAINYRLGAFGYLTTVDGVIPSNIALKDQNFALKWVNTNINLFGGDSSKITIMGHSAGASNVGHHILSKKSAGLFRAAIMQSGSPICSYAIQHYPKYFAFQLASTINKDLCAENSTEELFEVLNNASAETIKRTTLSYLSGKGNEVLMPTGGTVWSPVIEDDDNPNAFLTGQVYEQLKNGNINKVPLLIGHTSEEALFLLNDFGESWWKELAKTIDNNIALLIGNNFNMTPENKLTAALELKNLYTQKKYQEDFGAFIRFASDEFFTMCTLKYADLQSQYTDVYLYQFAYKGSMAPVQMPKVKGAEEVPHVEELFYMMSSNFNKDLRKFPQADIRTHNRLLMLWTNFIKYLNPTPKDEELLENIKWPKMSHENKCYLNINKSLSIVDTIPKYSKWSEIIYKYAIPPLVTF